jgi:DNA-binding CsgD family transcriptional regulator
MADPTALSHAEAVQLLRLVGECRELGDDASLWRAHFLAGLGKLLGCDAGGCAEVLGYLGGPLSSPGVVLHGFDHGGLSPQGWRVIWSWAGLDIDPSESGNEIRRTYRESRQGFALLRQEMMSDHDWDRSNDYQQVMRAFGAQEVMHSCQPLGDAPGWCDGVTWLRASGSLPFSEKERRLAELAHFEITRLIGTALSRFEDPQPSDLPPRVRQVLRCFLEGDTEKDAAVRLGISTHTVNDYTKRIYRHFGVTSRVELLARWLRRGWTNRAQWETDRGSTDLLIP